MTNNINQTINKSQAVLEKQGLYTVVVPNTLSEHELNKLLILVRKKRILFMHALGVNDVPVNCTGSELCFPWFRLEGVDGETEAYMYFIEALINYSKKMRVIPDAFFVEENERYFMRRFVVQLGLNGDKYNLTRKLLIKRLKGDTRWLNGKPVKYKTK